MTGKLAIRALSLLGLALLAGGCTASWSPRVATPPSALQWPFAPSSARLSLLEAITGFAPATSGAEVLKAAVFGAEPEERNNFVRPVAIAVGDDDRIAVADLGRHCVHLYLPAEKRYLRLTGAIPSPLVSPVGVAFDGERSLFVTDSSGQLLVFDADGKLRSTITAADGSALQRPTGIAFSPRANLLYVVDTLAHRIHAFRSDGSVAFSFGERGGERGQLNFPTHVAVSKAGELYVSDSLNFRIQIFDERGAVIGVFGNHGDGSGDLALPKGVAVDRYETVYVADSMFDNVQLFDRNGRFLLTLGQRGSGWGELWLPAGLFIDQRDRLYVCDAYNARVQIFQINVGHSHEAA